MSFPEPAPRTQMHLRNIECKGFLRDDGMWDIEAMVVDTKPYVVDNRWRGLLEPGMPIHNMGLRLTIDSDYIVQDVAAIMIDRPHEICNQILSAFQQLIGLRIGPGWNRKIKELLGGVKGCTHLLELLGPMATVVFQTRASRRAVAIAHERHPDLYPNAEPDPVEVPFILNGCHSWASDSPEVKELYPLHYTGSDD